jgi:hypothetical protein
MVRRNSTYDFSNRFESGLNVIVEPLTRSIPDNGGDHSPLPSTVRSHAERIRSGSRRASGTAARGTHRRLRRSAIRAVSCTVGHMVPWVHWGLDASWR